MQKFHSSYIFLTGVNQCFSQLFYFSLVSTVTLLTSGAFRYYKLSHSPSYISTVRYWVFGWPFVKRFALCYQTVVCPLCPVLSVTLVYSGQTLGRVNLKLGMQVGLGSGHIVLDRDPAPSPIFGPFLLRPNGWIHQDATWYGGRPHPRGLYVRRGPRSPSPKRGRSPQIFGPCLLWPNG